VLLLYDSGEKIKRLKFKSKNTPDLLTWDTIIQSFPYLISIDIVSSIILKKALIISRDEIKNKNVEFALRLK
jgi:hypothetical protein